MMPYVAPDYFRREMLIDLFSVHDFSRRNVARRVLPLPSPVGDGKGHLALAPALPRRRERFSGPVSFQISSRQYTEHSVSLDNQIIQKSFVLPLCPCDVPYTRTMWFAWIVATGGQRYAATSAHDTA